MKGQNLRLAIKDGEGAKKYIAAALSFDLSVDADTEESTTKDSTGGWKEYEVNLKGWSGSGQANLVFEDNDTTNPAHTGDDLFDMIGKSVTTDFDLTDGSKNRVLSAGKYTGTAFITSWKISAQNGQKVTVDYSFQGSGELKKATASEE